MKTLDVDKQLISDLWLDQRDAHERIDERLGAGELSDAEAEKLRNFADNGYMTFSLGLDSEFSQNFDAELDRLWRERPVDLAAAPKSGGRVRSVTSTNATGRSATVSPTSIRIHNRHWTSTCIPSCSAWSSSSLVRAPGHFSRCISNSVRSRASIVTRCSS